jgi:hypothetical protein
MTTCSYAHRLYGLRVRTGLPLHDYGNSTKPRLLIDLGGVCDDGAPHGVSIVKVYTVTTGVPLTAFPNARR